MCVTRRHSLRADAAMVHDRNLLTGLIAIFKPSPPGLHRKEEHSREQRLTSSSIQNWSLTAPGAWPRASVSSVCPQGLARARGGAGIRHPPYLRYISDGIDVRDRGGFPGIDQDLLTLRVNVYSSLLQIQTSGFWNSTWRKHRVVYLLWFS